MAQVPGLAQDYIFTTDYKMYAVGWLITVDMLAKLERGATVTSITPNGGQETSIGVFIQLADINANCVDVKRWNKGNPVLI